MLPRAGWLICLVCLGCQVTPPAVPPAPAPPRHDHISRAAAALAAGQDEQACSHLQDFVEAQPEHRNSRFLLAELLLQRGQHAQAREHFEQSIAQCQEKSPDDARHLLHCQSRLLAIAEALDDDYALALHKGIGLLLLAQARSRLGDPQGELPVEGLLCRAAGCLSAAHALKPDEAQPCWHLYEVWRQLGQSQLADRWRQKAQIASAFAPLPAAQQRRLALAGSVLPISSHP